MATMKRKTTTTAKTGLVQASRVRAKKPSSAKFTVVRSAGTGRYIIDGVGEQALVNKHPEVKVQAAPGRPRHLSQAQICEMVKLMKVA